MLTIYLRSNSTIVCSLLPGIDKLLSRVEIIKLLVNERATQYFVSKKRLCKKIRETWQFLNDSQKQKLLSLETQIADDDIVIIELEDCEEANAGIA